MQQASQPRRSADLENGTSTMNGHNNGMTANIDDDDGYPMSARTLSSFDQDIVRLIGQYLKYLGFRRTAENLVAESRCQFEHPAATKLRSNILHGDYEKALSDLSELRLLIESSDNFQKMKYLVLEQKYFEMLEAGRSLDALLCLRRDIAPLLAAYQSGSHAENSSSCASLSSSSSSSSSAAASTTGSFAAAAAAANGKARELSLALMLPTVDEVRLLAGWITLDQLGNTSSFELTGVRRKLLEKISAYLPRHVMVSEQRLQVLLRQAVEWQSEQCLLHNDNMAIENISLLSDHVCSRDNFPARTVQVLQEHCDEVWFIRFSPDGKKFASGAKDGTINFWDVDMESNRVTLRRAIELQPAHPIQYLAWSPNSQYLLICGPEDSAEVWVYDIATCERKSRVTQAAEDQLTSAAWFPDSKRFVCGGQRGQFLYCDIEGNVLDHWEGVRVIHLACAPDNKTVLAADNQCRLRAYVFNSTDSREYTLLTEDHPIISFALDDSGRYAIVHVQHQGIHLWDLQCRTLVRRFRGVIQNTYSLHGTWAPSDTIGGHHQQFIASGSEDGRVTVFHIRREEPVVFLEGHTRSVSCVHWNPKVPSMLASASDDGTVRIWAPERFASHKHASLSADSSEQQPDSDDESIAAGKSTLHATTQL